MGTAQTEEERLWKAWARATGEHERAIRAGEHERASHWATLVVEINQAILSAHLAAKGPPKAA